MQWLSWACGVSPEAARERLRVARALVALPAVSATFARGELSYSKVRAITRIATADNEALLVTYARHATASQLEQVVRDHRRVREPEDEQANFERRSLRWRDQGDGTTRFTWCLPDDVAAEVIAAIDQVADDLGQQPAAPAVTADDYSGEQLRDLAEAGAPEAPVVSRRWETPPPVEVRRADALRVMTETAKAHTPTPVGGAERYQVVVHTTDTALSNTETADPAAAEADASAADAATAETADAGAEASSGPARPGNAGFVAGAAGPLAASGEAPAGAAMVPARAVHPALDVAGPRLQRGGALPAETARMLACDAALVWLVEDADGLPHSVSDKTRTVPTPLRRALADRDKGCRFPGCSNTRFVDAHHVWHWANHGPTVLWNLVVLCRFHHRVIHHAGYRMYAYGDQTFSFHRPDGTPIPAAAPSPGGQPDHVERSNHDLGLCVDADSLLPDWDGTPPDYDTAAQALLDATFPRNTDGEQGSADHEAVSAERHQPVSAEDHGPVSAERLQHEATSSSGVSQEHVVEAVLRH